MRVAIFTETYLPHINGVVTHVKILAEGLKQLGHEVLVVTADASTHHHYVKDGVLHCPAINSKKFYGYSVAAPISAPRLHHIRKFKPDIIHIHNEFGIGMSGVIASKILKVPLVYTLHTMYDDYIYYIAPKLLQKQTTNLSHKYLKFLANSATELTGPSVKCRECFRLSGVEKDVEIIPNSVEMDEFDSHNFTEEQKQNLRDKYNIDDSTMLACFVGRLGKEKSVDVLMQYWAEEIKKEDKITLLVIGDGPDKEELIALRDELGLNDRVIFTGKIPHKELPPYYAICDAYITASLSEMHSISMLEGMCAGLPALQRTDPLNASQIEEGKNGFHFENAKQMAEKLHKIKALDQTALNDFKSSVSESIKNSGAKTLAQKTLAVYNNAIEKFSTGNS